MLTANQSNTVEIDSCVHKLEYFPIFILEFMFASISQSQSLVGFVEKNENF